MSDTFHGRDVMAPAVAMLACVTPLDQVARPIGDPVLLEIAPATSLRGIRIIHLDHFGNATTNLSRDLLRAGKSRTVTVRGHTIGKLRRTYWDVAPGKPIALIGSSGLLEIAIRDGSAAQSLELRVGDEVIVA
jgi:S-adenosylmethionine hydrolase